MKKLLIIIFLAFAAITSSHIIAKADNNDSTFFPVLPEVQAEAQRLGINTEGLSNIEVKNLITAHDFMEWRNKAAQYNLDIKGLSDFEVMYAVQLYESKLMAAAKLKEVSENAIQNVPTGNNVTVPANNSDELIKSLIVCPEVQAEAIKRGINCDGLTNLEVKNKISEQIYAENRLKANKYNLDITGLSDIQVCEKVYQYETHELSIELKKAEVIDSSTNTINITPPVNNNSSPSYGNLTMGEIETAGNMDRNCQDIIITAKGLGIDYKGLTYDELLKIVIAKKSK